MGKAKFLGCAIPPFVYKKNARFEKFFCFCFLAVFMPEKILF